MSDAQLDIEQPDQLLAYLRHRQLISAQEVPVIHTLSGGVSNRVVLVEFGTDTSWVIKQALPKLRVTVDWYSAPERIQREALALRALEDLAPREAVTPFIYEDHAAHLLIMRAVAQPHENWKTLLLRGQLEPDHVEQFSNLLATIHRRSALQEHVWSKLFDDRTHFESLRLEPYYSYTADRLPSASLFLRQLCDETRERRFALVHGDYSPKNILIYRHKLVLLDHEVVHWGDPAFDLGFALTHLISKAHFLKKWRQEFAQAAHLFWAQYESVLGEKFFGENFEQYVMRHTLACLLARVEGRSPLEYLDREMQNKQMNVVLSLLENFPRSVDGLIDKFLKGIIANE